MLASQEDAAPVKIGEFGIAIEMPKRTFYYRW